MAEEMIADFNRQLSQLNVRIKKKNDETRERILRALNSIVKHVVYRLQVNAPLLSAEEHAAQHGDAPSLRESITYTPAYAFQGYIATSTIAMGEGVEYFFIQNVMLEPAGHWEKGLLSGQQPMTVEGGVGGSFVERVIEFHSERYKEYLLASAKADPGDLG